MTRRLAVIGDIHSHFKFLDDVVGHISGVPGPGRLPGLDGVLVVGDVACYRATGARYTALVMRAFEALAVLGVPVVAVPGNHDLRDFGGADLYGAVNADGRVVSIPSAEGPDWEILGIGGAGPAKFGFPYEWSDEDLEDALRRTGAWDHVPGPRGVLLAHAPPYGILDALARGGEHVGSRAVRGLLERGPAGFAFSAHGHIHEARGVAEAWGALAVNAGALGAPYGLPGYGLLEAAGPRRAASYWNLRTGVVDNLTTG